MTLFGRAAWASVYLVSVSLLFLGSVLALVKEPRLPARLGLLTVLVQILLGMILPVH